MAAVTAGLSAGVSDENCYLILFSMTNLDENRASHLFRLAIKSNIVLKVKKLIS